MAHSSPTPAHQAAPLELDLAFSADAELAPGLVAAAGDWCARPQAEGNWQTLLTGWLAELQAELPPELRAAAYSLGLSLVSDAEIAALNGDWRQKEGPTDVLAFAAQDDAPEPLPPGEPLELGDILISMETAALQAPEQGHSLEQELLFLASHGLLHLLGWDHPDDASLDTMLARQQRLLMNSGG